MTYTGGYNPMRWKCEDRGCWKQKCSPKIERFAPALPRNFDMSDLDATVEVGGHFLFLEWKYHVGPLPDGQRIYFDKLTKISPKMTVVIVFGNPETMKVEKIRTVYDGEAGEWIDCDFDQLFDFVEAWATKHDI